LTKYANCVIKIGCRYLTTNNSFASMRFEYLLEETTVREIVKCGWYIILNCLEEKKAWKAWKRLGEHS
jgi:hypothetical protein